MKSKTGGRPTDWFVDYEPVGVWEKELARVGGDDAAVDIRRMITTRDFADFVTARAFARSHRLYAAVWQRLDITGKRNRDGLMVWEWNEEVRWEQGDAS